MNRIILASALLFVLGCSKGSEQAAMPTQEETASAPADNMAAPADQAAQPPAEGQK